MKWRVRQSDCFQGRIGEKRDNRSREIKQQNNRKQYCLLFFSSYVYRLKCEQQNRLSNKTAASNILAFFLLMFIA